MLNERRADFRMFASQLDVRLARVGNHYRSTLRHSRIDVPAPIGAAATHRDECIVAPHKSRVVLHPGDRNRSINTLQRRHLAQHIAPIHIHQF
jgi:hypothetical protein